jgi:hypothetical protein
LLNHAEQWCIKNGLELAPGKCKYISNYNMSLILCKKEIERVNHFPYLGIGISINGICWKELQEKASSKGRAMMFFMNSRGMNAGVWRLSSSINIIKSFIRSSMEYGLALGTKSNEVEELDKVIRRSLRYACSARWNTSGDAMYRLFHIEPMKLRSEILTIKLMNRIISDTRANKIWQRVGKDWFRV